MRRLPTAGIVLALVLALAGCLSGDDESDRAPARIPLGSGAATAVQDRFVKVVETVSPTVVQISTGQGLGSGVIFDDQGHVVTNHHVIGDAQTFDVTFADGRRYKATRVGAFRPEDLAVIRLEDYRPDPATFADSGELKIGQIAFAIGNPLGLRSSVTQGIVSSLGRTVSEGPGGGVISSAVQTSAEINPGNSGGALVDLDGRVIGIPTLAAVNPELGQTAPGIGFAIPSNTARRIADQLIEFGRVTDSDRAYVGVRVATTVGGGVAIARGEDGSPAAEAGLRPGELILSVNGRPTHSAEELATVLAELRPGDDVEIEVADPDGDKRTVEVTLGELPPEAAE
jgi:putative serine protease PepD